MLWKDSYPPYLFFVGSEDCEFEEFFFVFVNIWTHYFFYVVGNVLQPNFLQVCGGRPHKG